MATLNGITSGYTITARARITSITGTTAFKTDRLRNKSVYEGTEDRGAVSIDIDNSLINYGTITSITINYSGRSSNTLYDAPTGRTGYIDGNGNESWAGSGSSNYHSKGFAKKNKKPKAFSDTWTNPPRSNDGRYRFLIGVINEQQFTHIEWAEVTSISLNITYTPATYTVTWKNHDGTVLETDTGVSHGATPTYNGATPTKSATAQYTYAFSGWSPSVGAITGNTTYTAQFTATLRKYTVTWKNYDGSVLETDTNVPYGTTPTYNGATPARATDVQYTYAFKGWDKTVSAVTGNATYTAQFTATVRKYTVSTAVSPSGGGTVTGADTYEYGKPATLTAKANSGYTFSQWNDGVKTNPRTVTVTGNATYTAYFELDKINNILVNTSQSSEVLVNTVEAGEVLADTTKAYG